MKNKQLTFFYFTVLLVTFIIDRISKCYALTMLNQPHKISSILSCDVTLNRGISWNMFHSQDALIFWMVTIIVSLITALLVIYTIYRWYHSNHILGEILVISGAISNIVDRFLFGGVVDFIAFSCASISLPIFNLADVFIVLGVGIMFVMNYKNL